MDIIDIIMAAVISQLIKALISAASSPAAKSIARSLPRTIRHAISAVSTHSKAIDRTLTIAQGGICLLLAWRLSADGAATFPIAFLTCAGFAWLALALIPDPG